MKDGEAGMPPCRMKCTVCVPEASPAMAMRALVPAPRLMFIVKACDPEREPSFNVSRPFPSKATCPPSPSRPPESWKSCPVPDTLANRSVPVLASADSTCALVKTYMASVLENAWSPLSKPCRIKPLLLVCVVAPVSNVAPSLTSRIPALKTLSAPAVTRPELMRVPPV